MADETFPERVARLRAEREAKEKSSPQFDPGLIPEEFDSASGPRESDQIDGVLARVGILDAYDRWCGKMQPDPKGKRESIMISCPDPSHADDDPSAWANLDKDVYHCGPCGVGGDIYTIAGFHFGMDPKTQFPQLREAMAIDLGYVVQNAGGKSYIVEPNTSALVLQPKGENDDATILDLTKYLPMVTGRPPRLNWQEIFPNDTFLRRWMEITSEDDLPVEYYAWLGLAALGLAAGNDVVLADNPNVKTNLFLCLYGRSGIGKTRATRALSELLRRAMPYSDDPDNRGAQMVPVPGSAEALVDSFSKVEVDAVTQAQTTHPVRGLVRFDELSTLVGKSARSGSVLKPTLMEFFDSYEPVIIKSRGAGLTTAEGHFCSAITTTQPGAIRNLLVRNDAESGFVNRWIFVAGPEKKAIAYRREQLDISPCVSLLQGIKIWAGTKRRLTLEGAALDRYEEFFDGLLEPLRKEDKSDLLTRCDLHLKKIIALLTIDEELDNPTEDIVRRALLFWPYLAESYALVGAEIGGGAFQDAYDDTVEAIVFLEDKMAAPPKRRDIVRKIGRKHPADLVAKALKIMQETGVVEVLSQLGPSGRGSAIVTYHYVP